MKKIFLMILALMFILGTVENASAKSFENISENNQMILLDGSDDVIDEVVDETMKDYEDGDFEDDGEEEGDEEEDGEE